MDRIAAALAAAPDIDARKVEAAREALACGVYVVDPERIAVKILGLDRALRICRRHPGA